MSVFTQLCPIQGLSLKKLFTQKLKLFHHLFTLMSFQICMTSSVEQRRSFEKDKCIFDAVKVTMVTKSVWLPTILGYQNSFFYVSHKKASCTVRLQWHETEYILNFAWTVPLRWHSHFLLYLSIIIQSENHFFCMENLEE